MLTKSVQIPRTHEEYINTSIPLLSTSEIGTPTKNYKKRNIITPSSSDIDYVKCLDTKRKFQIDSRRVLEMPPLGERTVEEKESDTISAVSSEDCNIGRKGQFGHKGFISQQVVKKNTRNVYKIINKMTGQIGGNGNGGAIYGELTMGSMQKVIALMKEHSNLNKDSCFIDVGCGLGKPNIHVAQDPGVAFSYGIEMEHVRWALGMVNIDKILDAASQQSNIVNEDEKIGHRCILEYGDITQANRFDPFTHVYMFDIGFPPTLFHTLSEMFNKSQSPFLICYHGPKLMIDRYGFDVELIVQAPTSMHGSSENHSCYIYRRSSKFIRKVKRRKFSPQAEGLPNGVPCDPLYKDAWELTRGDVDSLRDFVKDSVVRNLYSARPKRERKPVISEF